MPPSDFRRESDLPPDEATPRVEPPHIVNLPSSFDMTEFPSEAVEEAPVAPALTEAAAPAPADPQPPATVIEFPAHPPEPAPAAVFSAAAHSRVITLADMLEERSGMEWRESVALVHKLCEQLKRRSQRAPVLLEPRNIRVTPDGDVTLLSEQLGGDPLVMQVGRLLRTMLMGRHAPPELRLLLAQATFELPIFQSVDEIDAALTQIERAEDARPPITEIVPFTSHMVTRTTTTALEKPIESSHVVTTRTIKPPSPPRRVRMRIPKLDLLFENYGATVIAGLAAVIAAVALFIAAPSLVNPTDANDAANRPAVVVRQPAPTTGTGADARLPGPPPNGVGRPASSGVETPALNAPATVPERSASVVPDAARPSGPAPVGPRRSAVSERIVEPNRGTAAAPAGSAASAPRAIERLSAGTNGVAPSTEFDALLQANPLYEPKASDLAPESLTAFRNSQKLLLPVLAQRGYDRAKAALASGDVDRAIASARETAAILDRPAAAPAAHLRDDVQRILEEAGTAKATADEVVYSRSDPGIVAPRPISRQFPATTPNGVPPHRVGTLEMIIGKDGTVEFVKLHTPLNRYHERMIVSAAKAWLYRPATRGGRPVRYRITVTINLPENGTY
jgi:hypothetical protein